MAVNNTSIEKQRLSCKKSQSHVMEMTLFEFRITSYCELSARTLLLYSNSTSCKIVLARALENALKIKKA